MNRRLIVAALLLSSATSGLAIAQTDQPKRPPAAQTRGAEPRQGGRPQGAGQDRQQVRQSAGLQKQQAVRPQPQARPQVRTRADMPQPQASSQRPARIGRPQPQARAQGQPLQPRVGVDKRFATPPFRASPQRQQMPQRGAAQQRRSGAQFSYRGRQHQVIQRPRFAYPQGFGYRRWGIGQSLPFLFLSSTYFFDDYSNYGFGAPPYGYKWVRYGPDLLLVNRRTGRISEVIYGVFY